MNNEKYIVNSNNKVIAAVSEVGYERELKHKYILFKEKPLNGSISLAASILTDYYLANIKQSLPKWKKDKNTYNLTWNKPNTNFSIQSKKISYLIFSETLRKNELFQPDSLDLPPMECHWLDGTLDFSMNFHIFDIGTSEAATIADGTPLQQYGEKYPIAPKLDREGHIFTTFQPQLINRIIKTRKSLIDNSEQCLNPDWILDLRGLINDSISLLDITLSQIYIKAEYSPEPGWSFDKVKMGEKNNRRLNDKLKWIRQISGNQLDIEIEFPKLDRLRKLRNHLNHFDPPTVVITLEEAVIWLNDILFIGLILIKIRKAMKVPVSTALINLIIQKEAVFTPEKAFAKRLPLVEGKSGYTSAVWTNS